MKTDTPRTDLHEATTRNPHYDPEEAEQLAWDVAKMMERELCGALERLAALEAENAALREDKARLADKQVTLRDLMAMQAYQSVATEGAGTIAQAAEELGIETSKYDCDKHWNKLVALRCYKVADAFLEVRAIDAAKGGGA